MVVYESLPTPISGGSGGSGGSNVVDDDSGIVVSDSGSDGSININTNNQNAMTINANQRIGINTLFPSKRLDVNDISGECLRLIYDDNLGRNIRYTDFLIDPNGNLQIVPYNGSIKIPANINGSGLIIGNTLITATGIQINTLAVSANGIAEANKVLTVDSSLNISDINTLTCNNLVSDEMTGVIQTAAQPNITSVGDLDALNTTEINIGTTNSFLKIHGESNVVYVQPYLEAITGSACDIFIGNYNRTVNTSVRKIMIKSNGMVGIGTNNPNKSLEINTTDGNCLRLTNNSNFTDLNILSDGSLNVLNNTTYLNYTSNSNVIGYPLVLKRNILTPSIGVGAGIQININDDIYSNINVTTESTLDKNGLFTIGLLNNNNMINVLQLNSYGTLRVQNLTELSDERSKRDIIKSNNEELFETIMNIDIKNYSMINDNSKCVGVIAQELKKIMPNAVDIIEYNGIKDFHCIKTKEILFTLIGAFQNLAEELKLKNIL